MNYDLAQEQLVELTNEFDNPVSVLFDSEKVTLEGHYEDELSVFRARRVWTEVLETNFLLEKGDDFKLLATSSLQQGEFVLTCSFSTACGRYAFWRLVNSQAPESQYLIETAHIPDGASHHFELFRAPDLRSAAEGTSEPRKPCRSSGFMDWLKEAIKGRR